MAFAVRETARHPLARPTGAGSHDDACSGFTRVADRTVAPPRSAPGLSDHARGHRYQGPGHLPGPDSHRQAALNLSLVYVMSISFSSWRPSSLGALAHCDTPRSALEAVAVRRKHKPGGCNARRRSAPGRAGSPEERASEPFASAAGVLRWWRCRRSDRLPRRLAERARARPQSSACGMQVPVQTGGAL
jgi:hypothetical protein